MCVVVLAFSIYCQSHFSLVVKTIRMVGLYVSTNFNPGRHKEFSKELMIIYQLVIFSSEAHLQCFGSSLYMQCI